MARRRSAGDKEVVAAPVPTGWRAHAITWAIVAGIVTTAWLLHVGAASDTRLGWEIRIALRAGDPRGPAREGAVYSLGRIVFVFATAFALSCRYGRSLTGAGCVALGTAAAWTLLAGPLARMILATSPDFPVGPRGAVILPGCLFVSIVGCLFGFVLSRSGSNKA
jgi:hypothetical protein